MRPSWVHHLLGGMGFGMKAFLGSTIQMGIGTVLNTVHFDEIILGTDYIITGLPFEEVKSRAESDMIFVVRDFIQNFACTL